jgi:hypothetical protein
MGGALAGGHSAAFIRYVQHARRAVHRIARFAIFLRKSELREVLEESERALYNATS